MFNSMKQLKLIHYFGIAFIMFSVSPLSYMMNLRLGITQNIIEPFLLSGLYLLSRDKMMASIFVSWLTGKRFYIVTILLVLLAFIGIIRSNGEFSYVYADFRCNMLLFYAFILFQQPALFSFKHGHVVKFMLWISIIMDLAYSLLYFINVLSGFEESPRIRMVCIINCVVLMVLYLVKWHNPNKAFILISILAYHTIVSAMRNFYIIFIASLIILMLYLLKEKGMYLQKLIIVAILVAAPIMYGGAVIDFWMSDGSRSIHSVNRVRETLSGETQETERTNSVLYPFTDPDYYIIPHGLGWRGFVNEIQRHYHGESILSSMDSQFYYLFFHYGTFLALFIVGYIVKRSVHSIITQKRIRLVLLLLCILYATAFFTQATMFAYLSFACYYGFLLSIIIHPQHNLLCRTSHTKFNFRIIRQPHLTI